MGRDERKGNRKPRELIDISTDKTEKSTDRYKWIY